MSLIRCMKCKKQTATKDEQVVTNNGRSRLTGACAECGTKKSKFIAGQKGKGIEADLAQEAYKPEPRKNIDGYVLDESLSNKKTKVYHNPDTKKTIVSHKGTDPKDKNDLKNDLLLSVGMLDKSKRFKNAVDISKKASEKYADSELQSVGHSLGSKVASEVGKKMSVKNSKVTGFNEGSNPLVHIPKGIYDKAKCSLKPDSNECKKLANQTKYHNVGDPISIGSIVHVGKTKIQTPKSINAHSISNYAKQEGKGCGCKKKGRPKKNN